MALHSSEVGSHVVCVHEWMLAFCMTRFLFLIVSMGRFVQDYIVYERENGLGLILF